jgi:hypothetical protein
LETSLFAFIKAKSNNKIIELALFENILLELLGCTSMEYWEIYQDLDLFLHEYLKGKLFKVELEPITKGDLIIVTKMDCLFDFVPVVTLYVF